jgi:hypothetical protein
MVPAEIGDEECALAVQPTLALYEVEKQQPIQQCLCFSFHNRIRPLVLFAEIVANKIKGTAEVGKEFFVEFLDGERRDPDDVVHGHLCREQRDHEYPQPDGNGANDCGNQVGKEQIPVR